MKGEHMMENEGMDIMESFGRVVNGMSYTENGAVGYSTSGNVLVDLNFTVPSRHSNVTEREIGLFRESLKEDPVRTVKWLFFLRDVREGMGERDSFTDLFMELCSCIPEAAAELIPLIPEYGRWKDVINIMERADEGGFIYSSAVSLVRNVLFSDMEKMREGKPVSLLAKWLPSVNASAKARRTALVLCGELGMTAAKYRKTLSALRSHMDVTEVKTCSGRWGDIDYSKVSSNANARYLGAFIRHDRERRMRYLESLSSDEPVGAVMHAGNLYPYEVYEKYGATSYRTEDIEPDPGVEALWNNLKDAGGQGRTMVVCDGSGSMLVTVGHGGPGAIDVARSMAVYFSERASGPYKDKVIEFSSRPRYIDLSACSTLAGKRSVLSRYDDCSNTNIEKVFDLLLKTALDRNVPQEDMPERILIISDMEFDSACEYTRLGNGYENVMARYRALFRVIGDRWAEAGYRMPALVFWNVNSRTNTIPVECNEAGVTLVSGFSPNVVKMVMSGDTDPWTALKSVLDSERYDAVGREMERFL